MPLNLPAREGAGPEPVDTGPVDSGAPIADAGEVDQAILHGTVSNAQGGSAHNCAPYPVAVNVNGAWQIPVVASFMSVVVFRCLPN
jgi:hypothetical protein